MIDKPKKQSNLVKIVLAIALAIFSIWIFRYFSPERLREMIENSGQYAEIVYVIAWTFLPMGFFPVAVLAFVGGLGFGLIQGSILTMIGAFLNMALVFLLSRYLFREWVQSFLLRRYPQSQKILKTSPKNLRTALILARLIPVVPYTVENYAFGLTDMNFWEYIIYSVIFTVPGTLVYVNFGDKSVSPDESGFIVSIILLILLVFGTMFLGKYFNFDGEVDSDIEDK